MKTILLCSLAAVLLAAPYARAQTDFLPDAPPQPVQEAIKYTLLKPNDKTSELVRDADRNPFGKSNAELEAQNQKGTNEENQIRELLEKLRVVGVSPGQRGLRVMLGDMVLEPGLLVPQVLPDQTISLRVANITAEAISLVWEEKKPTGLPPRTLTIAVDLRPYVRVQLMGQSNEKNQWEKQREAASAGPLARQFPGVAQTAASAGAQVAKNDRPPVERTPSNASAPGAAAPAEAPPVPPVPTVPAAVVKPEEKTSPEWEQALNLLNKLMPAAGAKK